MFNYARLIYISPDRVNNASKTSIDAIELYFHAKPKITGNKSNLYAPGVEIFITDVVNGVPDLAKYVGKKSKTPNIARKEYSEINTSSDASLKTVFDFSTPVVVTAGKWYAVIIKFDGDEDFLLWTAKEGDNLVGTSTPCKKITGKLFNYVNSGPINSYSSEDWKPLPGIDLKISVLILNTWANNDSTGTMTIYAQGAPTEFVVYDKKYSTTDNLLYGDYVFPDRPKYPNDKAKATCKVANGSTFITGNSSYTYANGATFNWSQVYNFSGLPEYIVVVSENHDGTGKHRYAVRQAVNYYAANNVLKVDEAVNFANAVAYFYKAPVARLQNKANTFIDGQIKDLLILTDSNANSTNRFVNNALSSTANIISGGSGYANSDYIIVTGYEDVSNEVLGGYPAYANLTTNSTGGITAIGFSNLGCGFVNGYSYSIKANTGSNSAGTSANITFEVGSKLFTEFGGGNVVFANTGIVNFNITEVTPLIEIDQPSGVTYNIQYSTMYYVIPSSNTYSGKTYLIDETAMISPIDLKNQHTELLSGNATNTPVITSRSNQFVIGYANGSIPNTSVIGTYNSNTSVFTINARANNQFTFLDINPAKIYSYYSKYSINNDYTNENTNYGNALAKHVTSKITLENDYRAEDLIVYVNAFIPANTDVKVLARIHNSEDPEAFDDKDWSLLEKVNGEGVYSNPSNPNSLVELTYNFTQYPNTGSILDGSITTSSNSATITGEGTTFDVDLQVNDTVKIYSPLFSNTNYVIGIVESITSNTELVLTDAITNASMVGSGFSIDKISYPLQAFNNITNDNVVRYYNSSQVEFDTFDTFQLKIIMLSDNDVIVPKIADVTAQAVSA